MTTVEARDAGWFRRAMRRARASVRLRVTLLAAGAFALTFFVAAVVLLRSLEDGLVDDLKQSNTMALDTEAAALRAAAALPADVAFQRTAGDVLLAQWTDSDGRQIVYALPAGVAAATVATPAERCTAL